MIEYISVFFIVIFLSCLAGYFIKRSKAISIFLSLVCIGLLSLLAALRGYSVGFDIHVYGWEYFYDSAGFPSLFSYLSFRNFKEPFYFALNYIIFKRSGNIHVLFFIMQFIMSFVVYTIAYREAKSDNGTFFIYILSYLFIWYNSSLNIMRQSLALIFVLYGFKYLENRSYYKFLLCVFIAFLFHSSAILCAIFPLLNKVSNSKNSARKLLLICTILIIMFASSRLFVDKLILIFPFFTKYFNYILFSEGNMIFNYAIFKILFLIVILLFSKPILKLKQNNVLYYIIFLDVIFYLSSFFIKFGYRISYFFLPFYIYLLPRIDRSLKDYKGRDFYRIVLFCLLAFYWYYRFAVVGYDSTLPYVFYWE